MPDTRTVSAEPNRVRKTSAACPHQGNSLAQCATSMSERASLAWLFAREARIASVSVYIDSKHYGRQRALLKHTKRVLRSLLQALGYCLASPLSLHKGGDESRWKILQAVLKLGRFWGGLKGLFGKLSAPYQKIDGC